MKAWVCERYGSPDTLLLKEIDKPVPGDDEVLVKVRAAGLNAFDWHMLRGDPYLVRMVKGLRRPRKPVILGGDLAGVVEAIGKDVTGFRPGDEVYAEADEGGLGEYAVVKEKFLGRKPANLTFEEAAAVPMAALTAFQGLRDAVSLKPGERVLVHGAGGGVGSFAVQIAKAMGAAEVTGVCSTGKVDLVRSLGADRVIDRTRDDFTRDGRRYDVILDTANRSLRAVRRALVPRGRLAMVGGRGGRVLGSVPQILAATILSPIVRKKMAPVMGHRSGDDLDALREMIEAGKVKPAVDRVFPFAEAPEAIRRQESGKVRGKVVVAVQAS
jgi:NADPH:quinone reductase-like Zn-dependent oxidoreductase